MSGAVTEKERSIVQSEEISADNQVYDDNDYGNVTRQNISGIPDDYSNQNLTVNPEDSPIKVGPILRFNSRQENVTIVDDLRRSFESSLMFDSLNERKLNQMLDKRESFSQIRMKKNIISLASKRKDNENV